MFTLNERDDIRQSIIDLAKIDGRLCGGAITGSGSTGNLDRWSDIDLAFGVRSGIAVSSVLDDYSSNMYAELGALHHLDVPSGAWIYRVFFLRSTLQVDLAFVPEDAFGARAATFQLIFGTARALEHDPQAKPNTLVGWAWLYALHARSSLMREKLWQAEYFISGMRDHVFSLCCLRHGLPEKQGRGIDRLPSDAKERFKSTLVRSLDSKEMARAFAAVTEAFLGELAAADGHLCSQLEASVRELSSL